MEVRSTPIFDRWFEALRDRSARARIIVRIDRLALGNPGDNRSVGQGVREMRIDYGPGYRIYYAARGTELMILLAGGDKSSQPADIQKAIALNEEL
jgi:putative addiction module killer protein